MLPCNSDQREDHSYDIDDSNIIEKIENDSVHEFSDGC